VAGLGYTSRPDLPSGTNPGQPRTPRIHHRDSRPRPPVPTRPDDGLSCVRSLAMGIPPASTPAAALGAGLSLAPMRGLRPAVTDEHLGRLLCPPYDVISEADRSELLAADPDNAVAVVLPQAGHGDASPEPPARGDPHQTANDPYRTAAARLDRWVADGLYRVDPEPTLYVYEMRTADGASTRGLLGAVQLRDPADGVILPHENTMAGPVADRLALMRATQADVEPIYLVYDGGGAASEIVADVSELRPVAGATTPDGTRHRLWALTDPTLHAVVDDDLGQRRALIADGHHRYATYRELQAQLDASLGPGPWDRGLALLVDSAAYGPQVHAIHRVIIGLPLSEAVGRAKSISQIDAAPSPGAGLAGLDAQPGFAAVLTDGTTAEVVHDLDADVVTALRAQGEPAAVTDLDVTVLHRGLVERVWGLADSTETVGYAHSVEEAIADAQRTGGTAVLLRPTPIAAVASVAAAGARMPRKSTLFTPKPASGLVMRRFADQR
jgi:uncharacterized protein (DUF1015 family)